MTARTAPSQPDPRARCDQHNRALTYAEALAATCSWCYPQRFAALASASQVPPMSAPVVELFEMDEDDR